MFSAILGISWGHKHLKFMFGKSKFNFVGGIADVLKDLDVSKCS